MSKDLINVLINTLSLRDYMEITKYIAELEELEEEKRINEANLKLMDNTTDYYLRKLSEQGSMPDEAVKMFNILEGNIHE